MGALHEGHLDLVKTAVRDGCYTLASIFVNPRQFNNPEDLKKYPRKISNDLELLYKAGTNAVFIPDPSEVYANTSQISLDISPLDSVFEGQFRPRHFQGVVDVLHSFFTVVQPRHVYFGQKDLQQCLLVEKLIAAYFPLTQQHNCPTRREASGLAMSSRNTRLSDSGKEKAANIYKVLNSMAKSTELQKTKAECVKMLLDNEIETEYLELVSLPDMNTLDRQHQSIRMAVVFAGHLEGVRLIDNILL